MGDQERCCGTCWWHRREMEYAGDWVCCNAMSQYYTDYTEYADDCDDWEERA